MIAIVGYEEFEKKKASWIPQNTRINTSWAVRVWSELSGRRNTTILSLETMRQFPKSILRFWISLTRTNLIIGSANSSSKFKLVKRRNFMSFGFLPSENNANLHSAFCNWIPLPVRNSKVEMQLTATRTFMGINFHYFFRFWLFCIKSLSRGIYTDKFLFNSLWIQFVSPALPATLSSPPGTFSLLNIQEGCTLNKGCWITKEKVWIMK